MPSTNFATRAARLRSRQGLSRLIACVAVAVGTAVGAQVAAADGGHARLAGHHTVAAHHRHHHSSAHRSSHRAHHARSRSRIRSSWADFGDMTPLTPWRKPPIALPQPTGLNYLALTKEGVLQSQRWRAGGWYCEYLGCANGPYPLLTIWGGVQMFESLDALQLASPGPLHRAMLDRFARASEHYWDPALGGYAPYPEDRSANTEAWFDDNGWLGLAFLNAYDATDESRYLADAERAFHFIASHGWDASGGGGMWWNTEHPYHSGPAIASDSLLGILLYQQDHDPAKLAGVKEWVDWANANDAHDERQLYLEKANEPNSVNDYVQAPLIYAQYLLCQDGQGQEYCVRAGRVAATLAEQHATASGYRYNYGPQYDSIFMQWMLAYGQATGESYWLNLAKVNAIAASRHASVGGLWLGSWWGGPIADSQTHADMFRTMASTTSLFAWLSYYTR